MDYHFAGHYQPLAILAPSRFGLWPFWHSAVSATGRFGPWPLSATSHFELVLK